MEKYLRLLNPKTTNFESTGGANHGAITSQDVCVAMSYAKLTAIQNHILRFKCFNTNTFANVDAFSACLAEHYDSIFTHKDFACQYRKIVIRTALVEFCMVPASYKPSVRNRAVLSGLNQTLIHRHLNSAISEVLGYFEAEFHVASVRILSQLNKTK